MHFRSLAGFFIVLLIFMAACGGGSGGGSSSYSLVGTWRLTEPTGDPFETVRMVFNSNGTGSVTYGSGSTVTGTWSLAANTLTITLTNGLTIRQTITWTDANHFRAVLGGVTTVWERV
jgi:hypothetical protein